MKTLAEIFEEAARLDGPLSARLAHYDRGLRASGLPWSAAYDELVARLRASKAGMGTPRVGEPFPPFLLPDERGRLVGSQALLEAGPLVVSFNRGHWCPFCRLELRGLHEIAPQLKALGSSIIAITPECSSSARQTRVENELEFPVLCDVDLELAMLLGLAIPIGERIEKLLSEDSVFLDKLHGGLGWLLPIPATFVLSRDGRVAARFVDPDFRRRMEIDDVLSAIEGLSTSR
jgi:peroxiredoxin